MPPKPESTSTARATLPRGPRLLARMVNSWGQAAVPPGAVAEFLQTEPLLTARVMAAHRATGHFVGEPPRQIEELIMRVGPGEIARLAEALALVGLLRHPTHLYVQPPVYFRLRALHTAFVLDDLSGQEASAYAAGLVHLAGIWVLGGAFPGLHRAIANRELRLQARQEELLLGINFTQAGSLALREWGFGDRICQAVARLFTLAPDGEPMDSKLDLLLRRAVAATDWHFGAKNPCALIAADLTIDDLEVCNHRAAASAARLNHALHCASPPVEGNPG